MFSKAKKKSTGGESAGLTDLNAPQADMPVPKTAQRMAPPPSKRGPSRGPSVPSLISADVLIKGSVEAEGEVQFDGSLEGDIRAKSLMIGETASVKGEVIAEKVRVAGTVEGAIRANQVELTASAVVKGDVHHTALSIEAGAKLDGNCRHSDNPTETKGPARAAPARVAPRPAPEGTTATADAEPAADGTSFLSHKGKADLR